MTDNNEQNFNEAAALMLRNIDGWHRSPHTRPYFNEAAALMLRNIHG